MMQSIIVEPLKLCTLTPDERHQRTLSLSRAAARKGHKVTKCCNLQKLEAATGSWTPYSWLLAAGRCKLDCPSCKLYVHS